MHDLKVVRHVYVLDENIDDIVTTALEGGTTSSWCHEVEVVGDYLGEYASYQISLGGSLKFYSDSGCNILTLDKFLKGLSMWIGNGGDVYYAVRNTGRIDCGQIDADMADAIIQYALFDEIVYS